MIINFSCKETEKLFNREYSRKIPCLIKKVAIRKLLIINSATELNVLRVPPGNCLEALVGKLKGYYSIRINKLTTSQQADEV